MNSLSIHQGSPPRAAGRVQSEILNRQSSIVNDVSLSAPSPFQAHTEIANSDGVGADHLLSPQPSVLSPSSRNFTFPSIPPENASARHHIAEAFSLPESSTEPNDGNALCPETKKQNNGACLCPEQAPFLDVPCASDRIAHMAGPCHVRPSNANDVAAGGGFPISENLQSAICNPKLKRHQLLEGQRRLSMIQRARELRQAGRTWEHIARALNQSAPTLIRWLDQVAGIFSPTAKDCAPQNHKAGRPPKHKLTPDQVAKIKSIALPINRNYKDTSIPEAIRRSLAAGVLPPRSDVESGNVGCNVTLPPSAQDILDREARGLPLLTEAMRAQVALTEMQVRAFRSPSEAHLDYVQSPGSLMLTRDEITGEERFFQPGEAYTIDDGSINFGCCVPLERPGDKCWEKFGVIVGRFQFIPVVDHRTRAILGFSYTARPRDSYRAEDLTATMQTVFAEHGLPRLMFLEFGTSDSNLVNDTLTRLGVEPRHVHSPHEKVVEKAFDILWTKLSSMPGQIGRFRGEMEEENCLLTACKQGYKDPRKYFPSLPQVVAALRQAIAEQNAQWMNSPQYGRWQPGEWFQREAHKTTRRLPAQDAWMFSPVITRPLLVRGFCVQTTVPLMPGFSLKFHFSAEFFAEHHGSEVILHFNPFAPECEAMVVLARNGQVLGPAQQINRLARFTRRAFAYGADPDIGHIAARKNAQALHRTVVALKVGSAVPSGPSGRISQATAEHRDGLGNLIRAEIGTRNVGSDFSPSPRGECRGEGQPTQPSVLSPQSSPEITAARKSTQSRLAQIANQLREETAL